MAVTDFVTYSLVDHKADVFSLPVFVPTGGTIAQLQALSDAISAVLDAVTGCQIQSASVNLGLTLPGGLKGSPTANLDIEKGANFGFDAANTDYRHTIRVPAIPSAMVIGELVDLTHSDIIAFRDAILAGVAPSLPSDRYGNDLTSLLSARVTFRKD
jgi:hypothetical protein